MQILNTNTKYPPNLHAFNTNEIIKVGNVCISFRQCSLPKLESLTTLYATQDGVLKLRTYHNSKCVNKIIESSRISELVLLDTLEENATTWQLAYLLRPQVTEKPNYFQHLPEECIREIFYLLNDNGVANLAYAYPTLHNLARDCLVLNRTKASALAKAALPIK